MENNPTAAAPAEAPAQATEAQPTTNTVETTAPAETAPAETTAPTLTADQEAILKFVSSNGGFDKVKELVSRRTADQPKQENVEQKAPEPQQPVPQQQTRPEVPQGYQTQQEFIIEQYYNTLANKEEYAPIADKIRSGEIFNEMAKFNIRPVDNNGYINAKQVNDFLSLYAKTVPAPAPANPVTTTPTVDYVNVGDTITTREDAMKVMAQAGHPMRDAAVKFMAESIAGVKKK